MLFANTPAQAGKLPRLEQSAGVIGLYVNSDKTEFFYVLNKIESASH